MADSATNIEQIEAAQASKEVTANQLFDAASPATIYGRHAEACVGLTWGYYGGRYGGTLVANGTSACGAGTTTYMVVDRATGVVSFSTAPTNWSDTTNYAHAYKIVSGTDSITSWEDHRAGTNGTQSGGGGEAPPTPGGGAGLLSRAVVQLIHDGDFGDDPDDIGAFAVMHRLADLGECEILACGYACDPTFTWGARAIGAMNTYFGRPKIPIGVFKGTGFSGSGHNNYGTYLATKFPSGVDATTDSEEAYKLYRRILAAQPDKADSPSGGVTFMTQGQLANLNALYNSTADEYSTLNGEDLMLAKCKEVVLLAGAFPSGSEFDLTSDATSAQVVNQLHASLPVVWSGSDYGGDVYTNSAAAPYSPVRAAFDTALAALSLTNRQSWGAMATIYAVRGLSHGGDTYATLSAQGANAVDGSGNNTFTTGSTKNQHYLVRSMATTTFASRIMDLQDVTPVGMSSRYVYAPIVLACSDRSTALTTGTSVASARVRGAGYGLILAGVRTSLESAVSTSGLVTADFNKNGTTVLPTKCSINASEATSVTAATPAVLGDVVARAFADDDVIAIDIDAAGTGAKGLIAYADFWYCK